MYVFIKDFYNEGLYSKSEVGEFTTAGWITPEEYEDITGEAYPVV